MHNTETNTSVCLTKSQALVEKELRVALVEVSHGENSCQYLFVIWAIFYSHVVACLLCKERGKVMYFREYGSMEGCGCVKWDRELNWDMKRTIEPVKEVVGCPSWLKTVLLSSTSQESLQV